MQLVSMSLYPATLLNLLISSNDIIGRDFGIF